MVNFGVHNYGSYLSIDNKQPVFDTGKPVVVDIETDEKDGFCGIGLTQDGKTIYYYTRLGIIEKLLTKVKLIGHNLKFDCKLCTRWGIQIKSEQIFGDTMLMSYSMNATKESHGLKELGAELGYAWPSYRDIVGKGRNKQTLDKQDVRLVANYCAMDVFVTYQLYQHLQRKMDVNAARIYNQIELPLMRILYEMELQGVLVDVEKLGSFDKQFRGRLETLSVRLAMLAGRELNPNSNKQVAEVLTGLGIDLPKTPKGNLKVDKFVLEQYQDFDFVKELIEFNKLEKLVSTYTTGLLDKIVYEQ